MKDFLVAENERNHKNHKIYEQLLRRACGTPTVYIGHHLTFVEEGCDGNEIPSADTVIFSLELMTKAFGSHAKPIMLALCCKTADERDRMLGVFLEEYPVEEASNGASAAAASS